MLGSWMLGCVAFWQGDLVNAHQALSQAVELYVADEQRSRTLAVQIDPGVNAQCHLGWVLWMLGKPDSAIAVGGDAIAMARTLKQPFTLAMTLFFGCAVRACCGSFETARPMLEELRSLTAEHGLGYLAACAKVLDGQALVESGRHEAGLRRVEEAIDDFRDQEAGLGIPWALSIAAIGWAGIGRVDRGLETLDAAFTAMARNDERQWEAELWRLRAELLTLRAGTGDQLEADASLEQALSISRRQGALALELRAAAARARIAGQRGDDFSSASAELEHLLERFEQGHATADLRAARQLIDPVSKVGTDR